ncbi:MAG TPA: RraA family protein [Bryobacteraceae bacterium]|jgi:4-hydroxy-4-methyl-2-oxoglutarate aldolase|nr:RraA family protein [Bryobacteraceae bacterium]
MISGVDLDRLRALDGCTISNAVERLKVRLRNEGFIAGAVRCRFANLPPMVGYAVTGRIRSSVPPMHGRCYYDRMDFWRYVATIPAPRVLVLQDVDPHPGLGAFVGEMHATIGQALSCAGYVTNGAVRDLPAVRALGFQLFSGCVSVSHAYAHLVDFGDAVEIGGLRISPGDLLHGDLHGVQHVPEEIAAQVPAEAEKILCTEQSLKQFCRSPGFSLDALEEKLKNVAGDCL